MWSTPRAGGRGFRRAIAGAVLVPQVVDAVMPIPAVASGGIGDGRGLVAALGPGAQVGCGRETR